MQFSNSRTEIWAPPWEGIATRLFSNQPGKLQRQSNSWTFALFGKVRHNSRISRIWPRQFRLLMHVSNVAIVLSRKRITKADARACLCFCCSHANNYNRHNIHRVPVIWLVKNGHLIVLTCVSFFNELPFVFMRGGDIHGRAYCDTVQCLYEEKCTVDNCMYMYLQSYTDIFRRKKHTTLKLTVFMQISCLIRSRRHLVFTSWRVRTRHSALHSLNAWNVINWRHTFKEIIIKKYLGERITKEVVIIRIKSYFS